MIAKDSKISESEVELKKREKQIQELQEEIKIFEKGLTDQNDIFTKKFQQLTEEFESLRNQYKSEVELNIRQATAITSLNYDIENLKKQLDQTLENNISLENVSKSEQSQILDLHQQILKQRSESAERHKDMVRLQADLQNARQEL